MINIALWIVFGAIAGWLAASIREVPANSVAVQRHMLVGILGALIGGTFMLAFEGSFQLDSLLNTPSLLVAIVGAIFLLTLNRFLASNAND